MTQYPSERVNSFSSLSPTPVEAAELRGILSAMTELILVMDMTGCFLKVVSNHPLLLPQPPRAVLGQTVHDLYPPEQANLFLEYVKETLTTKQTVKFEYSITAPDGEVWAAARTTPISETTVIWVARDITEQKRATEEVHLLLNITRGISEAPDFNTALEFALRQVCETTGWSYGEAWFPSADNTALECASAWYCFHDARYGEADQNLNPIHRFREYSEGLTFLPGEELPGQVWLEGQPVWVTDMSAESDDIFLRVQLAKECGLRAGLGVPIIAVDSDSNLGMQSLTHQGDESPAPVIAVLVFFMQEPRKQDQRLVKLVAAVATQLGTIIQHKQTEAEMSALFAAMNDVILVLDAQGCYQKIAPTNTDLLYRPPDELIGSTLHEIFDREQADFFISQIWQALSSKSTINFEYSLTIQNQEFWFSASVSPMSEDTVMWVARDITDRKQAEEALKDNEEYLRLVLDNIPQQVFWKDTNSVFLGCNKNWADAAGFAHPEDVIGLTDFDMLAPDIAHQFREKDRQIMETDTPELHVIASKARFNDSNQIVWLDISKIPIHNAKGKVIGILGVLEDITQRKQAEDALRVEQQKSERLLLNILPKAIADQLKQDTSAIAEHFDQATILFADIVGFTPLSTRMPATQLVSLLNDIFSVFDQLTKKHKVEKIKTIGDAYMVAGGLPIPRPDHADSVANFALEMLEQVQQFHTDLGEPCQIRIGIHTGPVVAGVIGIQKFIYDLWGDTVNVASRMESLGRPNHIQITESTYQLLQGKYRIEERGIIEVKGRGNMKTYWLEP